MSDFKEVMRQWTRMCKHYYNDGWCADECRLKETSLCYMHNSKMTDKDYDGIEQIVMTWAAANPEPVYPTWAEWLIEMGVLERRRYKANTDDFGWRDVQATTPIAYKPIPADIAEKLGVKPKS